MILSVSEMCSGETITLLTKLYITPVSQISQYLVTDVPYRHRLRHIFSSAGDWMEMTAVAPANSVSSRLGIKVLSLTLRAVQ